MKAKITNVEFFEDEERKVVVSLSNGEKVNIVACYESYEQYGSYVDILHITIDIADAVNEWLHGGTKPDIDYMLLNK